MKPPEIARRKAKGKVFKVCPSCEFESHEIDDEFGSFYSGACLVCEFKECCLDINCPNCGNLATFVGEARGKCSKCETQLEPEDLVDLLTKNVAGTKDYSETGLPAHCQACDSNDTVIEEGGVYICMSCFQT